MNATLELLRLKSDLVSKKNAKHIQEKDVLEILGNEFPSMNEDLENRSSQISIYKTIQCFSDHTKLLIRKGNFKEVKHCFRVADKMLKEGNAVVQNSINNCYLNSLAVILDMSGPINRKVESLLSKALRMEYKKQVYTSGV